MDRGAGRGATTMRLVRFRLEVRWSALVLLAAYLVAGVLTAVAGGRVVVGGTDGILASALLFIVLAFGAALFHELGHALAALLFGRRPLGLVLKAGAAIRIEAPRPGSRGESAPAESLVALGGPIASGLLGLAYFGVSTSFSTPFAWAGLLALFDAVANLVPVVHSDGERVLQALTHPAPSAPSTPTGGEGG